MRIRSNMHVERRSVLSRSGSEMWSYASWFSQLERTLALRGDPFQSSWRRCLNQVGQKTGSLPTSGMALLASDGHQAQVKHGLQRRRVICGPLRPIGWIEDGTTSWPPVRLADILDLMVSCAFGAP
eukprot:symbB.v1.2.026358.t1/scaffold2626.1/size122458/8